MILVKDRLNCQRRSLAWCWIAFVAERRNQIVTPLSDLKIKNNAVTEEGLREGEPMRKRMGQETWNSMVHLGAFENALEQLQQGKLEVAGDDNVRWLALFIPDASQARMA